MKVEQRNFVTVIADMQEGDIVEVVGSAKGLYDGYWKLGPIDENLNPGLIKPNKREIFIYKIKRAWRRLWSKTSKK